MKNKSTLTRISTAVIFFLPFCAAFSQTNTWTPKANFGGTARYYAVGFSIGTKGYIGTGWHRPTQSPMKDFWEWDQASDVWTQKANFGGGARYLAVGFSIGTKGYIGTGFDAGITDLKDLWEYNPSANSWIQKADIGGAGRTGAVGFSIGNKGYIGTGTSYAYPGNPPTDFWEWDQATDTWAQKSNFGGLTRMGAVGFSIGTKGYIGTSTPNQSVYNNGKDDFWEWDQATNAWTQKANFGGNPRSSAVGFSIGAKGYIGTGREYTAPLTFVPTDDFWEWDQASNTWTQKAKLTGGARYAAVGFSIGNKGYIGIGYNDLIVTGPGHIKLMYDDFWEYAPDVCSVSPAISSDPSPSTTLCVGQSAYISASGGTSYLWNTGSTTAFMAVNPTITTAYSVTVTDANGCTGTAAITFIVDTNCASTGISQINSDALQAEVWPNPSIGEFRIGDLGLGIYNLDLYNVFGEKVYADKIL
ncbi:MAG: hypothetical protein EPN85_12405, partial [Bacteroidetes bacterium]